MSSDPKLDQAKKLIDEFAAQLLALNDGTAVPRTWKNYLLKALIPAPQKPGKKIDYSKIAAISKELTLYRNRLAPVDRSKNDKREDVKTGIAKKVGTSVRTIERVIEKRKAILAEAKYEAALSVLDNPKGAKPADIRKAEEIVRDWKAKKDNSVDPQMRQSVIDGIAQAINEEITAKQNAQESAKQQQARRTFATK